MTSNPANSNLSPATQAAPAVGGPMLPYRLLLANGNGRGWRASLGFLLHTAVVALLFLLPLLMTEQITGAPFRPTDVTYAIQKGDPQGSGLKQKPKPSGPQVIPQEQHAQPKLVLPDAPIQPTEGGVRTAGFPGDLDRLGLPDGIDVGIPAIPPTQNFQRPIVPALAGSTPVRVGGRVREPKLLRRTEPVYPVLAKQAGIQGTVVLEATLGTDGRVEHIVVVSGHPLLVEAAQRAVAQWVYAPTTLNDQPVPVLLRVTVEFILRR